MSREDKRRYDAALLKFRAEMAAKPSPNPILLYLRASSAIGFLIGIAGMIMSVFFWWAAGLIYVSLIVGLLDLSFEKSIKAITRLIFAVVIVLLLSGFTFGVVTFKAPLESRSYWFKSDYPPGTEIAGIKWMAGFSELRVSIRNPTDRDYEDLDLSILSNEAIVQISQVTSIPCVPVSNQTMSIHDSQGNVYHQLFEGGSKRFRCDKFPRSATIEFILATANVDDLVKGMFDPKEHPSLPAIFYGPKRKPQWVKLDGSYRVTYRPHEVHQTIDVGG